jgi:hypothetical protein
MRLHRVVVSWAGPSVTGLAVNVLHFDATEQAAPPVAAIRTAYQAMAGQLPSAVTVTVPPSGETIDDSDGTLTGVWSATAPAVVTGGVVPQAAAGVGACVTWNTGGIVAGTKGPRRLRGRTFLVPLANACYDADGTLTAPAVTALNNFGTSLIAAGGFGIWHRPTSAAAANGTSSSVLSHKLRDKVAYLSSRRD